MRVLRKAPEQKAEVIEIDGSLESLQKETGGYIQAVPLFDSLSIICNEDGKMVGLPFNFRLGNYDEVVGTVIFVREEKDNFCSVTDGDIKKICNHFGFESTEYVTRDLPFGD